MATGVEAASVLGLPIALFFARPLWHVFARGEIPMRPVITDHRLLTVLIAEVALSVGLLWWLRLRGWRLGVEVALPRWGDAVRGVGLWVLTFLVGRLVVMAVAVVAPAIVAAARAAPLQGVLSWWVVGAALAINPVFEEVLWLGYAVPAFERLVGTRSAMLLSLALRTAVHYNQGVLALVSVLPVGLVFTGYFIRTRRLWPVIVAHVIVNAFGLGALARGA